MRLSEVIFLQESIVDDLRNSLVKGLKPDFVPGTGTYDNLLTEFEKVASWARSRLRKGDAETAPVDNSKVVWLLNWYVLDTKLQYCCSNIGDSIYTDSETQKIKNKAMKEYGLLRGQRYPDSGFNSRGIFPMNDVSAFATSHIHYLGTPSISQKVQGMPLKPDMTPLEALEEWKGMEDEWLLSLKDEKRSIFHPEYKFQPENTLRPFIQFEDGSAWFNLNKQTCEEEGQSMGHCGNTASYNENDTIFSYRSPHPHKTSESGEHWIPHLTFIYNKESGMLGEMKGYGNQKPVKKYHEVIKTLIMSDHVTGIVGGGYLPEENFSVWDLADAEELVEKKPKLAGDNLQKYINNMGVDESFEGMVQAKLGEDTVFEIIDKEKIDHMSKSYRLDLVDVRLTDVYPNFEKLMEAEFHDSPYWQLLKGTGEWDIDETASRLSGSGHLIGLEERFEQIMQYSPSQVKAIIVDELAHYSNEDPNDVEDNMWKYVQEPTYNGRDFLDWIVQATTDATLTGYQSGLRNAIFNNAVRYIEEEFGNGYLSYGAKWVELALHSKKPGRWTDSDNPTFIQAKMMEVVEVLTDMENGGDNIPNQWWSGHAVEYDENDLFSQEAIIEEVQYDYIKAIQQFNESLTEAPKLHSGEDFVSVHKRMKDDFSESVNEDCGPEGKKKVKRLAHTLINIAPDSKVMHKKLHMLCAKLGLSHEQCHALTHREGYT